MSTTQQTTNTNIRYWRDKAKSAGWSVVRGETAHGENPQDWYVQREGSTLARGGKGFRTRVEAWNAALDRYEWEVG